MDRRRRLSGHAVPTGNVGFGVAAGPPALDRQVGKPLFAAADWIVDVVHIRTRPVAAARERRLSRQPLPSHGRGRSRWRSLGLCHTSIYVDDRLRHFAAASRCERRRALGAIAAVLTAGGLANVLPAAAIERGTIEAAAADSDLHAVLSGEQATLSSSTIVAREISPCHRVGRELAARVGHRRRARPVPRTIAAPTRALF